jgi:Mn-dependent DtxR family transcriptional regulator
MGEIDETARRLLREMGYLAEGKPTPDVAPKEAAENLDLEAPEYSAALSHLLALGDIERISDSGLTEGLYRLTKRGLRRAREIRWR